MKFIFDFDDVLFFNTKLFKENIYAVLEKNGIPRTEAEKQYKLMRDRFSLKDFLNHFALSSLYDQITDSIKNFRNEELLDLVKKIGKQNCYLVSFGQEEFQNKKITKSGVAPLFSGIFIVQGSKKEVIEKICKRHLNEKVIFVDDKAHHFENLDNIPNLQTILFDDQGLAKLKELAV